MERRGFLGTMAAIFVTPFLPKLPGPVSGPNLIEGLGTSQDNASIWLCAWDADSVHGIFPKRQTPLLKGDNFGNFARKIRKPGK